MSKLTKAFSAAVTIAEGERAVVAVVSTNSVDRDGETLIPMGCNAKEYEANPVLLFLHSQWSLPVGKCASLKREKDQIVAKFIFADRPETHPEGDEWLPDTLYSLFKQGVLNAFSVGFIPKEMRPATDKDVETFGAGVRRVISKWNLLEISVVPLPCNQDAVAMAVGKGILTDAQAKKWLTATKAEESDDADDTTCSECGEKYEPDDEDDDGMCEKCGAAEKSEEDEEDEEKAAPIPEPKRMAFFVEPPPVPAPDPTAAMKQLIGDAVAKRRGIVYIV